MTASTMTVNVESKLETLVYAPYSHIQFDGQGGGTGNFFAARVQLNGQATVSVTTAATSGTGSGPGFGAPGLNAPNLTPPPAVGPSEAFVLGESYSFPNPAVGGQRPTLHIECGLADTVEFRIYNVAGELVHQDRVDYRPTIVNNKYAYEYTWDTSGIASGVYIAVIQAKKGGEQDIRVMKKIAVVK